jgi:hypothetical protein
MLARKDRSFIFIHNPKTAGTSIKYFISNDNALNYKIDNKDLSLYSKVFKSSVSNQRFHSELKYFKKILSNKFYKKCFKFYTIRNPYDKIVSLYCWLKQQGSSYNHSIKNLNDSNGVTKYLDSLISDRSFLFLSSKSIKRVPKNISFREFVINLENICHPNELINFSKSEYFEDFDDFIRFENLQHDLKRIFNKLNLETQNFDIKINQTDRKDYKYYYDSRTIEKVYNIFKADINYFKYDFN